MLLYVTLFSLTTVSWLTQLEIERCMKEEKDRQTVGGIKVMAVELWILQDG